MGMTGKESTFSVSVSFSTETSPLTLFFETLKNRVSRKLWSDLVLKLQNETHALS